MKFRHIFTKSMPIYIRNVKYRIWHYDTYDQILYTSCHFTRSCHMRFAKFHVKVAFQKCRKVRRDHIWHAFLNLDGIYWNSKWITREEFPLIYKSMPIYIRFDFLHKLIFKSYREFHTKCRKRAFHTCFKHAIATFLNAIT